MSTVLVTYIAPEGDDLSVTMGGLDFVSGSPVEIDPTSVPARFLAKLRGNQHFDVSDVAAEVKRGPGRPPKVKADAENI